MQFFIPRDAPVSVLWARVLVPLVALFAYVAFRAIPARDGYLPIGEVLPMFAVVMGLTMVMLIAATELTARRRVDQLDAEVQAKLTNMLERTALIPGPVPRTPVTMLDSDDVARIHGDRLSLVDQGVIEPGLFTHEFQPEHHTPARGIQLPGRHRVRSVDAEAQLGRERTGQFFGQL